MTDYTKLKNELDQIVNELNSPDIDLDLAISKYKKGIELIEKLEAYLKTAKNQVKNLNSNQK